MIKKQIKEVENAQVRIEKNKANLLNKQKGTKDIISEDKVKELQAENKILNEQIRANNNLDTVIKQESAMQDEIAKVNQELTIRRTEDEALLDADGVEQEVNGIVFLTKLTGWSIWKQTSYALYTKLSV